MSFAAVAERERSFQKINMTTALLGFEAPIFSEGNVALAQNLVQAWIAYAKLVADLVDFNSALVHPSGFLRLAVTSCPSRSLVLHWVGTTIMAQTLTLPIFVKWHTVRLCYFKREPTPIWKVNVQEGSCEALTLCWAWYDVDVCFAFIEIELIAFILDSFRFGHVLVCLLLLAVPNL